MDAGYEPLGPTAGIVERWRDASADAFLGGKSTEYLRQTGQLEDLSFIVANVDDVDATVAFDGLSLTVLPAGPDGIPAGLLHSRWPWNK
jgi:hypothetical protein